MRKSVVALIRVLLLTLIAATAHAQGSGNAIDAGRLPLGMVDLNDGWQMRSGDNMQWAQPESDASGWSPVTLGQQYALPPRWTCYRLTLTLPATGEPLALLVRAPGGSTEAYVDGERASPKIFGSWVRITRSSPMVVPLPRRSGVVHIALRSNYPEPLWVAYASSLSVQLGGLSSIQAAAANTDHRTKAFVASGFLNLAIVLGGIGALALSLAQRGRREYLWLGYFLLLAVGAMVPWRAEAASLLPLSVNSLISDPLTWAMYAALIEFLFAFIGSKVTRGWRLVQAALLSAIPLAILAAEGVVSSNFYWSLEGLVFWFFRQPCQRFCWFSFSGASAKPVG